MGVGFGSTLRETCSQPIWGPDNGTRMAGPTPDRGVRPPPDAERQRTHAAGVRFTAAQAGALKHRAGAHHCSVAALVREDLAPAPDAVTGAAPAPTASAEPSPAASSCAAPAALLNDAARALHASHGYPDAETLDALRHAAEAVARQLGRWP